MKDKRKLSEYLKLFAIYMIEANIGTTRKKIIQEINSMTSKAVIDTLPCGILSYLKKIDA
jgi:hypothetical protein